MKRLKSSSSWKLGIILLLLLATPDVASAHGGESESTALAGSLAWGFLGFGMVVIAVVSFVLFKGNGGQGRAVTAVTSRLMPRKANGRSDRACPGASCPEDLRLR